MSNNQRLVASGEPAQRFEPLPASGMPSDFSFPLTNTGSREPTGREIHLWGITQWQIKDDKIQRDWTNFNEFGVLMQIFG